MAISLRRTRATRSSSGSYPATCSALNRASTWLKCLLFCWLFSSKSLWYAFNSSFASLLTFFFFFFLSIVIPPYGLTGPPIAMTLTSVSLSVLIPCRVNSSHSPNIRNILSNLNVCVSGVKSRRTSCTSSVVSI